MPPKVLDWGRLASLSVIAESAAGLAAASAVSGGGSESGPSTPSHHNRDVVAGAYP